MNEKMYGKLSDSDKERAVRGLEFVDTGAPVIEFKKDNIPDDNEIN
jgi:hypothetical protein